MLIDTHSHMFDAVFDGDRPEALRRAREAGVGCILCPAIDSESHAAMLAMCAAAPDLCRPMMGLHPTSVNDNPLWECELETVERHLASPPAGGFCAVGEIGLDLHWSRDSLAEQTAAFERQLELALHHDLAVAIHTRDAWPEMLAVMERYAGRGLRGVMHAFSGSADDYRRVRAVGDLVLGVGGAVTYKKSALRDMLPAIDPAHIVLETDAPWLTPVPLRGSRNESAYLVYVRDAVAAALGLTSAEVERTTTANARRIFKIDVEI